MLEEKSSHVCVSRRRRQKTGCIVCLSSSSCTFQLQRGLFPLSILLLVASSQAFLCPSLSTAFTAPSNHQFITLQSPIPRKSFALWLSSNNNSSSCGSFVLIDESSRSLDESSPRKRRKPSSKSLKEDYRKAEVKDENDKDIESGAITEINGNNEESKDDQLMNDEETMKAEEETVDKTRSKSDSATISNYEYSYDNAAYHGAANNDHRYAASDWIQNIKSLPRSTILKAIRGPLLTVSLWSTFISVIYKVAPIYGGEWGIQLAKNMCIKSTPHSFLVSALGLLLVFRTNSAYQRFNEGRLIWEDIHSTIRNLSRMLTLYSDDFDEARRRRIFQLMAAFPYLLHYHVQPQQVLRHHHNPAMQSDTQYGLGLRKDPKRIKYNNSSHDKWRQKHNASKRKPPKHVRPSKVIADYLNIQTTNAKGSPTTMKTACTHSNLFQQHRPSNIHSEALQNKLWVDRRTIPWCFLPPPTAPHVANSENRPLWICDYLGNEINQVPYRGDQYTNRERMTILSSIGKLSQAVGRCERIHQTAVPLNYARHSLRSLTLWLFTLPFSLVQDFGWLTGPVMGLAAWLFYGIYQIGYSIEDPFQGSLRLTTYCDAIYRDVIPLPIKSATADSNNYHYAQRRLSAFQNLVHKEETPREK